MRKINDVKHTINQCEARGDEGVNTPHEDAIDDRCSDNGQVQNEFLKMRSMKISSNCNINSHKKFNLTANGSQVEISVRNLINLEAVQSGNKC
jgi:hypothetical protein